MTIRTKISSTGFFHSDSNFLMRQLLLVAALYCTALSAAPLTNDGIKAMVDAHNAVRQRVAQEESARLGGTVSIPDLTWDPDIAAIAQQWADNLINQNPPKLCHRCGGNACDPPLGPNQCDANHDDLGENLYYAWSTGNVDQAAKTAVKDWASEKQWYHYNQTPGCDSGRQCGHYTQLVWSNTQRLGCGKAVRKVQLSSTQERTYVVWVCNYAPAGNITGQYPYAVNRGDGVINDGGTNGGNQKTRSAP